MLERYCKGDVALVVIDPTYLKELDGDVWTDLGELENLVRLADSATDPSQKEECLARARELAQGELLPEFPYDKHIEEYRQYYNRLRKRLFGE